MGIGTVNKEMYTDILRRLRDVVRTKNNEKMENQALVSPSRKCSSTPVGFGRDFIVKRKVTTRKYPSYCPGYN